MTLIVWISFIQLHVFSKLTFFPVFCLFIPPVGYSVVLDPIDFHCLETWNFSIVFIYLFIYLFIDLFIYVFIYLFIYWMN